MLDDVRRRTISKTALSFLGCPRKLTGRDKSGIDCLGVVIVAYRSAGIELPDIMTDSRSGELHQHFAEILERDAMDGDVVRWTSETGRGHVAIVHVPAPGVRMIVNVDVNRGVHCETVRRILKAAGNPSDVTWHRYIGIEDNS